MIDIVITADYEVFGNGTGDVQHCLVNPTTELLAICDEYGAKLTLFFEVVEYWAFEEAGREGKLEHLPYSPSGLMREQAREAVGRGHDVQLHVHPQWLESEYTRNGWQLNLDWWRLPNVPHGLGDFDDVLSLRGLLSKGKYDLEEMLRSVCRDYECVALRAGGYCIQPARDVIQAMKEAGLLADSSVFKGGYIQEGPFNVDFRNAPSESAPWWADPQDITKAVTDEHDTILEMPIYTVQQRRIEKLTLGKIPQWFQRGRGRRPSQPYGCKGYLIVSSKRRATPKTPVVFFRYLFEPVATQWDYCNLTDDEMWWFVKRFLKKDWSTDAYSPLVMIGHPKSFANQDKFRRFLDKVTRSSWFRNGDIRFSTMREAVRRAIKAKV